MNPYDYNSDEQQQRPLVLWLIRFCLLAGCIYTGTHNYALYLRGLSNQIAPTHREAVAFGIALLLEAAFYFSVEGRGRVFVTTEQRWASGWGAAALFSIIALNTITDHAANIGKVLPDDWLAAWANYGAAACMVAVIGYIGFLKANSPEAQLAAAASTAAAARVFAKVEAQKEILADPQIRKGYRDEAARWALQGLPPVAARSPVVALNELDADRPARNARPNA